MAASLSLPYTNSPSSTLVFRRPSPVIPCFAPVPISSPRKRCVGIIASSKSVTTEASKATKKPTGLSQPRPISLALQELLGVSEIPRTQALKQIWAYIKQHDLQDAENKKIIICDDKLKRIFGGKDRVGFLEISGLLNSHFIKSDVKH